MELVFLGIGALLLLANCVFLFLLVRRHSDRPIAALLTNLQAGQVKQEQLFRDELGRSRLENAGNAREHRQELILRFSLCPIWCSGEWRNLGNHKPPGWTPFQGSFATRRQKWATNSIPVERLLTKC